MTDATPPSPKILYPWQDEYRAALEIEERASGH
jgi:hypothetical protein